MKAKLHWYNGSHTLKEGETTLGRSADCDVSFEISTISKLHLTLFWDGELLRVRDEKSTNGTSIDGEKIEDETEVAHGQRIDILGVTIKVTIKPWWKFW